MHLLVYGNLMLELFHCQHALIAIFDQLTFDDYSRHSDLIQHVTVKLHAIRSGKHQVDFAVLIGDK